MPAEKLFTALMSALSDSLAPPRLVGIALMVLVLAVLRDSKVSGRVWYGFLLGHFILAMVLRIGELYAGLNMLRPFWLAAVFYVVNGILLIVAGGYFAFRWYRWYLSREGVAGDPLLRVVVPAAKPEWQRISFLLSLLAGAVFALFAFTWPVNMALAALSGDVYLPGYLWSTVWCMFVYELVITAVAAVLLSGALFCFQEQRRKVIFRYRSLALAVAAGVYMSLGFGLVNFYTQQLF
ncbi:MAG: hypothetical protein HQL20_03090 [Candidatus Omnitrophica bacterium]|nr:hypothetical protein [Candidatus Omnitrophota bacterium]